MSNATFTIIAVPAEGECSQPVVRNYRQTTSICSHRTNHPKLRYHQQGHPRLHYQAVPLFAVAECSLYSLLFAPQLPSYSSCEFGIKPKPGLSDFSRQTFFQEISLHAVPPQTRLLPDMLLLVHRLCPTSPPHPRCSYWPPGLYINV